MKRIYLLHWQYKNEYVKLIFMDGEFIFISLEDFTRNFSYILLTDKDTIKKEFKWKMKINKPYYKPTICFITN